MGAEREYDSEASVRLREILREKGYDGLVYPNAYEGDGDSYIAFYDRQIIKTDISTYQGKQEAVDADGVQWAGNEKLENDNVETEEKAYETEQTDEVSDRDRDWTDKRSGGRSGGRTKNNDLRATERRTEKAHHLRNAVRRANIERTSLRSEGLPTGSDEKSLVRIPEELWTDDIKAAAKLAEDAGLELVPLVGTLRVMEGKKGHRITAAICNGKIYAKADCDSMSVLEEVRHEIFHDKADQNPELVKGLMEQITIRYTDEDLQQLFDRYYDLYEGVLTEDMDEADVKEYIWEEMLADAYAEYQRYPEYAEPASWTDKVREAVERAETKNTAKGGDDKNVRYSAEKEFNEKTVKDALDDALKKADEKNNNLIGIGEMHGLICELSGVKGELNIYRNHSAENMLTEEEAIREGRAIYRGKKKIHFHGLGKEKQKRAILKINDPIMAIQIKMEDGSPGIKFILPEMGKNEVPLYAVVSFYSKRKNNGSYKIKPHIIRSVAEQDWFGVDGYEGLAEVVESAVREKRVLYYDKNKRALLSVIANQARVGNITEKLCMRSVSQFKKYVNEYKAKNKINYSMETALTTGKSERSSNGLPVLDAEYTEGLPTKAESYLRRVERELVETIGEQMEIPFMQRRGGLREAVDRLAQEYLQSGDVSQHEPLTQEAVKQLYSDLKTARRTAEKARQRIWAVTVHILIKKPTCTLVQVGYAYSTMRLAPMYLGA